MSDAPTQPDGGTPWCCAGRSGYVSECPLCPQYGTSLLDPCLGHGASDENQARLEAAELHARRAHPDFEYATTTGPRKQWDDIDRPPAGENADPDYTWERNIDAGRPGQGWDRFDYTEESYWRRRKSRAVGPVEASGPVFITDHVITPPPPPTITIQGADGQALVTIHPTGELDYGPGYTPDEAARRFWEAFTPSPSAELALLHEGEEPYTQEGVIPTPAQWIWKWSRATPTRRLQMADAALHAADAHNRCLLNDHQGAVEELHTAHQTFAALHRLAAELEAAEAVGGAWDANQEAARRIRAALGEETP